MYKVDLNEKKLHPLTPVKFVDLGVWERLDIEEWIAGTPAILGEDENSLLILAKELPVNDNLRGLRLDLLGLDRKGRLVVIELKRDDARGDVDWQGIKYAARCSRYTVSVIVSELAKRMNGNESNARRAIVEHLEGDFVEGHDTNEDIAELLERTTYGVRVRIILVAREFHPDVAAAALWLRESEIDISCVRIKPYKNEQTNEVFLVPEKIIPLPETADYTDVAIAKASAATRLSISVTERRGQIYSNEKPNLDKNQIASYLRNTLERQTPLTPRLRVFLNALLDSKEPISRDEIKEKFVTKKIAVDVGLAGRYLSNISQFITKRDNGHLRQIIEFDTEGDIGDPGARKDNYRINDNYRALVKDALTQDQS